MDKLTIESIIYNYPCIWQNESNYIKMSDVIIITEEWSSLKNQSLIEENKRLKEEQYTLDDVLDFADHFASGVLSGKWSYPFKGNIEIAKEYFTRK